MRLFFGKSRVVVGLVLGLVLALGTACKNKKVSNPLADLNSKQPDKVLFDRAIEALKSNRFEVARLSLQTLINTYPDSEYIARAKLGIADSWYAEGGTAAYTQAEIEYTDFQTFFPNMPESSEAQFKIANIHFQEMEKPDRDFTHALHAEDAYRQMILQYPDSPLLPKAKDRLLQVQEVLGEREFRVGHFYFMRESYAAATARLQSLVEKYPLYSKADEAYYLLGQTSEAQIARIRALPTSNALGETTKANGIKTFTQNAAAAYSQIVKRYPMGLRADDAKARLEALHVPVPHATPEMVAQNKKEMESREPTGKMGQFLENFRRRPDTNQAAKGGEPTMVDPKATSATDVARAMVTAFQGGTATGTSTVGVQTVTGGTLGPSQAAPRSDAPTVAPTEGTPGTVAPDASSPGTAPVSAAPPSAADQAPNPYGELKPDSAPPSDATPAGAAPVTNEAPPPAPAQTNEILPAGSSENKPPDSVNQAPPAAAVNSASSSTSKKKKGKKIFPF